MNTTTPQMMDLSAQWPSRYHGGMVHLYAGGSYGTPVIAGACRIGEVIAVDPAYPLYAKWTGAGWVYSGDADSFSSPALSLPPTIWTKQNPAPLPERSHG